MSIRRITIAVVLAAGVFGAWVALAQTPAKTTPAPKSAAATPAPKSAGTPAPPPAIATVGELRIPKAEFDQRYEQMTRQYQQRTTSEIPVEYRAPLRRRLLENLIRQRLLVLEARRRGMTATVAEAEEVLRQDPTFQVNGAFSEAKFITVRNSQPDVFQRAIRDLQATLPARRLADQLEKEHTPSNAELQASANRKLSRATMSVLALRRSDFEGDYPEPTEAEIIAWHQAHPGDYRTTDEVRATLIFVSQPALPDSLAGSDLEMQAWLTRMRQRADSTLGAVRRGAKLEAIAAQYAWPKQTVVLRPGAFPSYWKGDAQDDAAVMSMKPGEMRSVPGVDAHLIVRVDAHTPAGFAALSAAAPQIRARMRIDARARHQDTALRALYATVRDSLRGPAWRIRYAALDTATVKVAQPSASEIDRYYRGHLADYSSFDAAAGTVIAKPLAEVRDDVRRRIVVERRDRAMSSATEKLYDVWSRGRRDPKLEREMTFVREVGPLLAGSVVDSGLAGAALTDSMATRWGDLGSGVMGYAHGLVVYQVYERTPDHVPSFEEARPALVGRLEPARHREEEAEARRLYDADPSQFRVGDAVHFTRLVIPPADMLDIKLTRAEVERQYREHIDRYSAPELSRIRHILIEPTDAGPEADQAARRRADDLLERVHKGEKVADLARRYSDDLATRDQGGDVGVFRRGMMLDEFERVAFTMRAGDVRGPVRTPAGWHIMECLEYVPRESSPLAYCYPNVAGDVADAKADEVARRRADSLYRTIKTPAQGRAAGRKTGYALISNEHVIGSPVNVRELQPYFQRLEQLPAGSIYPGVQKYKGMGWVVSWVDSVAPERVPSWESAHDQALDRVRRRGSLRKLTAKRVELDSLGRSGWSLDSLGGLWGGLQRLERVAPGATIARLGGRREIDSLAFGSERRAPALAPGQTAGWIDLANGSVRVRLDERIPPDPVETANAIENERRIGLERNLQAVFDKLKTRYPVRILDAELRATALPPLPDS